MSIAMMLSIRPRVELELPTEFDMGLEFAGGGTMTSKLALTQAMSVSMGGGGEMAANIDAPVPILPQDSVFTHIADVVAPSIIGMQEHSEPFTTDSGQLTLTTEGTIGSLSFTGGQCVVSMGSGTRSIIAITGPDIEFPDAFISLDVVSNGTNPTGYNNIGVGIAKDANNFIYCSLDRRNNTIRIQVKIGGSNTFLGSTAFTMGFPSKIALSLMANSAIAWTESGGTWTRRVTQDISSLVDLQSIDLTGWKTSFTVATPNTAVWTFDNLVFSRFGAVGLRDITLITNEDGSPVDFSGNYRFTASAAAPAGSHTAVYEYNPTTHAITQVGVIWVERGGVIYNDLAAHLVQNDDTTWRYLVSTWGNGFGGDIFIAHKDNVGDLSSGSHLVSGMTELNLPYIPSAGGAYDPYLIRDGSDWLLAYAITDDTDFSPEDFYPAAATSPDMSTWTGIDAEDAAYNSVEGPKIYVDPDNGTPYIMNGGRGIHPVYDRDMNYLGEPSFSPALYNGTDTQPHIMLFQHGDEYRVLTWDNTKYASIAFTWGTMKVYGAPKYEEPTAT